MGYILSFENVLPQFANIKNRIGVTDEAFIEHLAEWNTDSDEEITKDNIKNVIPDASFYGLTTRVNNALTDHINKIAIEALTEINVDTLYAQRANHASYYWLIAAKYLMSKIHPLPDNLTEFGKKILIDIASGNQTTTQLPTYLNEMIDKLDRRKIKSTMTDIRNEFCNGKTAISAAKFQFFESWFRLHGHLKDRAGEVLDKIVKPVIADATCQSLILQNQDFYIDLINTAGEDAYEVKKVFRNLAQKTSDTQWIEFVNSIDPETIPEIA